MVKINANNKAKDQKQYCLNHENNRSKACDNNWLKFHPLLNKIYPNLKNHQTTNLIVNKRFVENIYGAIKM